jgi:hypothetical protein
LHDFVRQPTISDYFMRDSALLGLDACAGRNNAGIDAHTFGAASVNSVGGGTIVGWLVSMTIRSGGC